MNAVEQYRAWTDGIERRNWLGVEDVERCVCLADAAIEELEAEVERLNWMLRTLVREGHERKNRRAGYRDFYELVLQDLEDAYYAEKEREP